VVSKLPAAPSLDETTRPKFTEIPIAKCPRCGYGENAAPSLSREETDRWLGEIVKITLELCKRQWVRYGTPPKPEDAALVTLDVEAALRAKVREAGK
jgi:hypothetical protein